MKKFAFAALAVMVMGLFGFAGCKLPDEVVEVTTDKWCKKEVQLSKRDGTDNKVGATVYAMWSTKSDANKNITEGLNIVIAFEGPAVRLFNSTISEGKYYVQKSYGNEIENENSKLNSGKKLTRDYWASLYLSPVGFKKENKNVGDPEVWYTKSGYSELKDIKQDFDWREILIEYLLYGGN